MGGGGDGGGDNVRENAEFWRDQARLDQEMRRAADEAARTTQQQITGTQLDWLRQYGQSSAMQDAGIPAPFAGGTGFEIPILGTKGNVLPIKAVGATA